MIPSPTLFAKDAKKGWGIRFLCLLKLGEFDGCF